MRDDQFEWDDDKAARNLASHGIRFEVARAVFKDPLGIGKAHDRFDYGEVRFNIPDCCMSRIRCAVDVMISARGAERHEQRRYHGQKR